MKLKRTLQPMLRKGEIVFGYGNDGITRRIADTDENRQLVLYFDGQVKRDDLKISSSQLQAGELMFKSMGLLTTNHYEKKARYSRNVNFFELMDTSDNTNPAIYQDKLEKSQVVIVGLGGIGSVVAEELTRSGVENLKLIDFDCADSPREIDLWFDRVSSELQIPVVFGSYASTTINAIATIPQKTNDLNGFLEANAISNDTMIDTDFPTAVISPVTFMAAGMVGFYAMMILTGLRQPTTAVQIDLDGWEMLKYDVQSKTD